MKYRVHGYCLIPAAAEIEVEAGSEDDALRVALAAWEADKQALIVGNSEDASAAFDWRPSAEAVPND